jgi:hypothetical protein
MLQLCLLRLHLLLLVVQLLQWRRHCTRLLLLLLQLGLL